MTDSEAVSRAAYRLDRAEFFRGPAMCECGHSETEHADDGSCPNAAKAKSAFEFPCGCEGFEED